ncbi:uncharacterized protein LOC115629431 [Scaptodrosophila lebanonensis]|uniref:Uncharacterized protein LOC115629431 n=1 Tax=Drosophila lebanonensis TaxID=7225 RepID=A0A6J2U1I6_DROLE|nr:uncharacterized protein LOC115629431 [Scaptodrosophila lebanonensis]
MQRVPFIARSTLLRPFFLRTYKIGPVDFPTKKAMSFENKSHAQTMKIAVIGQNQDLIITTMAEAQKLARRRGLNLVLLEQTDANAKTGRSLYKLVTNAEMLADDFPLVTNKMSKKSEKSLTISTRISNHDLESRLKNIARWLEKRHEVCILIQSSGNSLGNDEDEERIVQAIEHVIKEPQNIGRILQKRTKGSATKFNIIPLKMPVDTT